MRVSKFHLDSDVILDNFGEHPERVFELLPPIRKLLRKLNEEGYKLEVSYDYSLGVPDSISVIDENCPQTQLFTEKYFHDTLNEIGIPSLFK